MTPAKVNKGPNCLNWRAGMVAEKHPSRIGRSCERQKGERIGGARKTGDDEVDPALRADKLMVVGRGFELIGPGVGASPHLARSDSPRRRIEGVGFVVGLSVGGGDQRIDIVERGQ